MYFSRTILQLVRFITIVIFSISINTLQAWSKTSSPLINELLLNPQAIAHYSSQQIKDNFVHHFNEHGYEALKDFNNLELTFYNNVDRSTKGPTPSDSLNVDKSKKSPLGKSRIKQFFDYLRINHNNAHFRVTRILNQVYSKLEAENKIEMKTPGGGLQISVIDNPNCIINRYYYNDAYYNFRSYIFYELPKANVLPLFSLMVFQKRFISLTDFSWDINLFDQHLRENLTILSSATRPFLEKLVETLKDAQEWESFIEQFKNNSNHAKYYFKLIEANEFVQGPSSFLYRSFFATRWLVMNKFSSELGLDVNSSKIVIPYPNQISEQDEKITSKLYKNHACFWMKTLNLFLKTRPEDQRQMAYDYQLMMIFFQNVLSQLNQDAHENSHYGNLLHIWNSHVENIKFLLELKTDKEDFAIYLWGEKNLPINLE